MASTESLPIPETSSPTPKRRDLRALSAIASFVIGILDLPAFFCGWLFAFVWGASNYLVLMVISIAAPFLLCLGGIATGIFGLRSKRRIFAFIGIALSGLFLLLVCGFIGINVVLEPNGIKVFTGPATIPTLSR